MPLQYRKHMEFFVIVGLVVTVVSLFPYVRQYIHSDAMGFAILSFLCGLLNGLLLTLWYFMYKGKLPKVTKRDQVYNGTLAIPDKWHMHLKDRDFIVEDPDGNARIFGHIGNLTDRLWMIEPVMWEGSIVAKTKKPVAADANFSRKKLLIQGHDTKGFAIGREFGSTTLSMYFIDCVFADKNMISIIAESYEENESVT